MGLTVQAGGLVQLISPRRTPGSVSDPMTSSTHDGTGNLVLTPSGNPLLQDRQILTSLDTQTIWSTLLPSVFTRNFLASIRNRKREITNACDIIGNLFMIVVLVENFLIYREKAASPSRVGYQRKYSVGIVYW